MIKKCECCSGEFYPKDFEGPTRFSRRRYCSKRCFTNSHIKSWKTRYFQSASIGGATECWKWKGIRSRNGRPWMSRIEQGVRKSKSAHRFAYELAHDVTLLPQEPLHHMCQNKLCVNPAHLIRTTYQEHQGRYHRPTHCKRGHALTEDNTYLTNGGRTCRRCAIDRAAARKRRLRDMA